MKHWRYTCLGGLTLIFLMTQAAVILADRPGGDPLSEIVLWPATCLSQLMFSLFGELSGKANQPRAISLLVTVCAVVSVILAGLITVVVSAAWRRWHRVAECTPPHTLP